MDTNILLIIVAVIIVALIPIVPNMIKLRIWVLRKLHLKWFADLHENHFRGFTLAVRVIFAVLAMVLISQALWDIF